MRLDLSLTSEDFKEEYVSGASESIRALDWKKPANSQTWTYNPTMQPLSTCQAGRCSLEFHLGLVWWGGVTGPKNPDGTLAPIPPMTDERFWNRESSTF